MANAVALATLPQEISVLAVDSTYMNSQLLSAALGRDNRFRVLEPTSGNSQLASEIARQMPAVAVISAQMDDDPKMGFEILRELRAAKCPTRVVMLLDSSDRNSVVEAFRSGARGVFSRSGSLTALAKCVWCVSLGQVWANSQELEYLLQAFSETMPMRIVDSRGTVLLSKREQEVVRCVAEGMTNREIAQRLTLTEHTVRNYLFRIFDKLGVSRRVEVVLYAYSLSKSDAANLPPVGDAHPTRRRGTVTAFGPARELSSAKNAAPSRLV